MLSNHLFTAKAFAGSGAQLIREGREAKYGSRYPSAHEPPTTAVFISAGEQAPVETRKLSQRWRVNCSLQIAGGIRPRCGTAGIVTLVRLVMRIA